MVSSDRTLGGFAGSTDITSAPLFRKRRLLESEGVTFDEDGRVSQSSMMGMGQLQAVVSSNIVDNREGEGNYDIERRSTSTLSLKKRNWGDDYNPFNGKRTKIPHDSMTSKTGTSLSFIPTGTTVTTTISDDKDKLPSQQPWTSLVTHDMLKSEILSLLQSRAATKTC